MCSRSIYTFKERQPVFSTTCCAGPNAIGPAETLKYLEAILGEQRMYEDRKTAGRETLEKLLRQRKEYHEIRSQHEDLL